MRAHSRAFRRVASVATAAALGWSAAGVPAAPVTAAPVQVTPVAATSANVAPAGVATADAARVAAAAFGGPRIHSWAYSRDVNLDYTVGVPGKFTFQTFAPDVASIAWWIDGGGPSGTIAVSGDAAEAMIAPTRAGQQTLFAVNVAADGTRSEASEWAFVVDDGPGVTGVPAAVAVGTTLQLRLAPRRTGVVEYLVEPIIDLYGEHVEPFVVPARADGAAELTWMIPRHSVLGLSVRTRAGDGSLSGVRRVEFGSLDPATPVITQLGGTGLDMPISFRAHSVLPGRTQYVAVLDNDPSTRQTAAPGPDGSATFVYSVTERGQHSVSIHAVNAGGARSAGGYRVWSASDRPLITSAEFPADAAGRFEPGTFTFTPRRGGTTSYEYAINGVPGTLPARADGTATLRWTPPTVGDYTLTAHSVSASGVRSVLAASHAFTVEIRPTTITSFWPEQVMTGAIRTVTVTGTELTARDTVTLTPQGGKPITAKVLSVSADRTKLAFEVDLRTAKPGTATIVLRSAITGAALPGALYHLEPVPLSTMVLEKAPKISGSVQAGGKVTVSSGWWPDPFTHAYQWKANGVALKGATGESYTIPAAQVGKRLTVTVSVTRTGFHPKSATSAATGVVAKGSAAKATKKPAITGTAKVGRTVTAAAGTWSPKVTSYKYEWRLNGKVIKGKTGRTLKLTSSMRNKKLTVRVLAVRPGYLDGSATSAARKVVR